MERLDYAILFATKAHEGQKRKSDNVSMIFHPFTVSMLLKNIGMNEDCVIAGVLHDVVEDTKYTLDDIEKIFGNKVRNIVNEVSEDKSLSWHERKQETIDTIKNASIEGKMVACADKVNNLETLFETYKEKGEEVWNSFNKPKEDQKWYYTHMYNAIMNNLEENELTNRYKKILNKIFN